MIPIARDGHRRRLRNFRVPSPPEGDPDSLSGPTMSTRASQDQAGAGHQRHFFDPSFRRSSRPAIWVPGSTYTEPASCGRQSSHIFILSAIGIAFVDSCRGPQKSHGSERKSSGRVGGAPLAICRPGACEPGFRIRAWRRTDPDGALGSGSRRSPGCAWWLRLEAEHLAVADRARRWGRRSGSRSAARRARRVAEDRARVAWEAS